MEQLNRIELRGSVGYLRIQTVSEKQVAHLSVATNYIYKSRTGEPVIETTWHNITVWEGKGVTPFDKLSKGVKVHIIGRLRNQRYTDNDGIERTSTDVIAYQLSVIEDTTPLQYEFVG